ncbi:MAG: hypothetical protein AAGI13_13760 [Pseudomonadota bacterium]
MKNQPFTADLPSHDDIERLTAQARQMRSDVLHSGFLNLGVVLSAVVARLATALTGRRSAMGR